MRARVCERIRKKEACVCVLARMYVLACVCEPESAETGETAEASGHVQWKGKCSEN